MKDFKEKIFEHLDSFNFVNITEVQCAIENFCYPDDWPQSASMWELLEYQERAEEYCKDRWLQFEEDNPITFPAYIYLVVEHDPDYRWWTTSAYTTLEKAEASFNWNLQQFFSSWKLETIEDLKAEFENEDAGYPVDYTPNEYLDISKIDYQLFIKTIKLNPDNDYLEELY